MVQLDFDGLKVLHGHAVRNGTLDRWSHVALDWCAGVLPAVAERDTLSRFAKWVVDEYRLHSVVDGGCVQEKAAELGVIVAVEMDGPCGAGCTCAEVDDFPLKCYRDSPLLELLVPDPPPPPRNVVPVAVPRPYRASAILTAAPPPEVSDAPSL